MTLLCGFIVATLKRRGGALDIDQNFGKNLFLDKIFGVWIKSMSFEQNLWGLHKIFWVWIKSIGFRQNLWVWIKFIGFRKKLLGSDKIYEF